MSDMKADRQMIIDILCSTRGQSEGVTADAILQAMSMRVPEPNEICCGKPDVDGQITNEGSVYSQAEAWRSLVDALNELQPGWILQVGKTAAESAIDLIRQCFADASQYHVVMAEYTTDIYQASRGWPVDIRNKLSIHDLRRMNGWRAPSAKATPPEDDRDAEIARLRHSVREMDSDIRLALEILTPEQIELWNERTADRLREGEKR